MKLWRLATPGQALPSTPGLVLGPEDVQVEVLQFHPSADGILLSAVGKAVKVWDADKQLPLTGMAVTTALLLRVLATGSFARVESLHEQGLARSPVLSAPCGQASVQGP